VAAAAALAVTFSADHSTSLGYLLFGLFAVLSAAVVIGSSLLGAETRVARTFHLAQGVVMLATGAIALVVPGGGLPFLIFLVALFAIASGFIELYLGVRGRQRDSAWRDAVFLGALSVALAVVVLLVPPGFSQAFTGPDGVPRQLTASVIIVGLLGAYWAVCAVYLVIAGLSLRWSTNAASETSADETAADKTAAEPSVAPQERSTP
jgi:uncharacterized membrane protein HdeD (DUF308 family)